MDYVRCENCKAEVIPTIMGNCPVCFTKVSHKRVDVRDMIKPGKIIPLEPQEGLKYDQDKLLMSLVEPEYIEEIAEVLTFGAKKYKPNSWQTIPNAEQRYKDAMLRHTMAYLRGEDIDPESGLSHLSHIATNIMFLSYFRRINNDNK